MFARDGGELQRRRRRRRVAELLQPRPRDEVVVLVVPRWVPRGPRRDVRARPLLAVLLFIFILVIYPLRALVAVAVAADARRARGDRARDVPPTPQPFPLFLDARRVRLDHRLELARVRVDDGGEVRGERRVRVDVYGQTV